MQELVRNAKKNRGDFLSQYRKKLTKAGRLTRPCQLVFFGLFRCRLNSASYAYTEQDQALQPGEILLWKQRAHSMVGVGAAADSLALNLTYLKPGPPWCVEKRGNRRKPWNMHSWQEIPGLPYLGLFHTRVSGPDWFS